MAKYYIIGNYTAQAFKGFIKDPKQDRAAAANALANALDAKMESFSITRGSYDFVGSVNSINSHSARRFAIVFLRASSFSEKFVVFPSNANNSLKCTM